MNKGRKIIYVLKKYGYYALGLVVVVALAFTVALLTNNSQSPVEEEKPVQSSKLEFGLPLENATLIKAYSDSELLFNATLNQWEAHKAVDLLSENNTVYSVLDGTVLNVEYTYETGTKVTISHADGYQSIYSSLESETNVKKGDNIKKGDIIGKSSNSASEEQSDGNHLHFELVKDGSKVDPSNYIEFELK